MVRSLRELEWREEKGEERGFARQGRRVAAMSPKEENRRGSSTGTRARIKSQPDAGQKEKHTVHEYGGCGKCRGYTRIGC